MAQFLYLTRPRSLWTCEAGDTAVYCSNKSSSFFLVFRPVLRLFYPSMNTKYVDQSTLLTLNVKGSNVLGSFRGNISLSDKVRCPADFDVEGEPGEMYLEVEEEVLWASESFLVMSENREGHVLSTSTAAGKSPNHQKQTRKKTGKLNLTIGNL